MTFPNRDSVIRLYSELDFWILINIADDIVKAPEHRQEYKLLVNKAKSLNIPTDSIPKAVRTMLRRESQKPFYKQKTFYWLLWLAVKKKLSIL